MPEQITISLPNPRQCGAGFSPLTRANRLFALE